MLKDEKILNKVEKIVNDLFNQKIKNWSFLWEGYISEVYTVELYSWKQLVLKFLKQWQIWWFEYPLENIKSLVISDLMMKNIQNVNWVNSWGVYEIEWIYFQIMDFVQWRKMNLDDFMNEKIIDKIAEKIARMHIFWKGIVKNFEEEFKERYWKRWFREVFSNNETLLSVYEVWYSKSNYEDLGWKIFQIILDKYRNFIRQNNFKRLTTLHWDFWYDNVIVWEDDVYFIDFSRIPYWDPAIDVGRFIGEAIIRYVFSEDIKWKKVIDRFLNKYIEISKDEEVLRYLDISILWVFYINTSPLVQQFLNRTKSEFMKISGVIDNYDNFIKQIIK